MELIKQLELNKANTVFSKYTLDKDDPNILKALTKTNIFIGANNSGKSRFMRELFIQFNKRTFDDNSGSMKSFNDVDVYFLSSQKIIEIIETKSSILTDTKELTFNQEEKNQIEAIINSEKKKIKDN